MIIQTLHLFPDAPNTDLVCYLQKEIMPQAPARRAVIICPGGGYAGLSDREDEVVALEYLNAGFQVFTLHYGVGQGAAGYAPLIQACSAIRHLRENAAAYHILPDRIFITGFSAGGHCAASSGTMYNHPAVRTAFQKAYGDEDIEKGRPDGMILCYPVISSAHPTHRPSFLALCGNPNASEAQQAEFSLEQYVCDKTPPCFLWHTSDDPVVPVQNSLLFASALAQQGIPFEVHIYPHGAHGLSLCDERTWVGNDGMRSETAAPWISLAIRWAKTL